MRLLLFQVRYIGVAIFLEAYMAYEIAKTVGIKFENKNFVKIILATGKCFSILGDDLN